MIPCKKCVYCCISEIRGEPFGQMDTTNYWCNRRKVKLIGFMRHNKVQILFTDLPSESGGGCEN